MAILFFGMAALALMFWITGLAAYRLGVTIHVFLVPAVILAIAGLVQCYGGWQPAELIPTVALPAPWVPAPGSGDHTVYVAEPRVAPVFLPTWTAFCAGTESFAPGAQFLPETGVTIHLAIALGRHACPGGGGRRSAGH